MPVDSRIAKTQKQAEGPLWSQTKWWSECWRQALRLWQSQSYCRFEKLLGLEKDTELHYDTTTIKYMFGETPSLFRSMSLWSWLVLCCPRHPERKSFLPGFSNGWKMYQPRKTEMSTDCRYSTLTVEMPLPLVLGIRVAAEYKTMSKMSLIDGRLGWQPASPQKMRAPPAQNQEGMVITENE